MNKQFANLIPPNARSIIEFVDEEIENLETTELKEKYLQINFDCDYKISNTFDIDIDNVDVMIFNSESFGRMTVKKLSSLIKKISQHLKDDGLMLFVLENVSYAENITALIEGKPPTVKATMVFDELQEAITSADMKSMKSFSTTHATSIKRAIAEVAETQLDVNNHVSVVVKNSAAANLKKTLIQSYLGEVLVCANIRVNEPNNFIAAKPNVFTTSTKSGETLSLYKKNDYDAKIFINQRVSSDTLEKGLDMFDNISKRGYLFIEEMDDNPILWRQKYEEIKFISFIGCHAIQTSTNVLVDFFKQFNPNVKVFENQLKELPPRRDFKAEIAKREPITVFFGALNRDKDFAEILPAVNKIAADYGENILFKVIAKTQLFDSIESRNKIMIGKKEIYNGQYVPYEEYEQALRTSHIALLPLRDNLFNRSKSDLKFIECAGNGAVVLASPTVYAKTVRDGETGFIYHDVKEFYDKFKILINNQNKRMQMAENAYEYVKNNRLLSQHYLERWNWYQELIARLPELNEEAQKRIELLKSKGVEAFGGFSESDSAVDFTM